MITYYFTLGVLRMQDGCSINRMYLVSFNSRKSAQAILSSSRLKSKSHVARSCIMPIHLVCSHLGRGYCLPLAPFDYRVSPLLFSQQQQQRADPS